MTVLRAAIHPAEKRSLLGMGVAVGALHLIGWGALFVFVLPGLARSGGNPAVLLGLAVSAYLLGVRHAFDADHIVAIDNTTRRLIATGRRPVSVGFWFALGHSAVVLVSVVMLVVGINAFAGGLADEGSALRQIAGVWGAAISGLFLILMGALNLSSLTGLRRVLRDIRAGRFVQSELDGHLANRGLINRLLRPMSRLVDAPWKMFPIGVLFGLGLDTAASISLFVFAGVLTPNLPWYAAMVLPIVFMAGMALFDSADGILMNHVYRWASTDPVRKVYYNLIVTGVSVFVAFFVGGMGLMSMLTDLGVGGGVSTVVAALDLNSLGAILIGLFALAWLSAVLWWHFRTVPSPERHP
ncbi:HoxN/HupN/NixA family nickel/cobalt transporter [Cryobacterium sp. PH31-AA6]|uniref:HoxN/HupN/NixA family nickel/cobalt transporter n=1 Tax=Cryobacterium sp. PH31-AA6 TaxID=3046205 RepID=UPI0024BA6DE9|nr:HoxN/HupN/NixA family nickel/cobalt transporter [Cryobacterium sp. PH31-AA6]MDJ0324756.1 HoxN/HupN/NixA family nickel/cobalt transporter [Cryobacterium sp. PH31-AA6]